MPPTATPVTATPDKSIHTIEYLSPPAPVSMGQHWFEIASLDHFWFRRRLAVLQRLADHRISSACEVAEFGCGHGLLQRQVEDVYDRPVWGFDLNEGALRQNASRRSQLYCYDVFQRDGALRKRFDLIFLFDVLEHISDESSFLQAVLFHLASGGSLLINVPAGQWAFSSYDDAVGHVRRYSIGTLQKVMAANGLGLREWSYWGLPLVPSLMIRKIWVMAKHDQEKTITAGFDARSNVVNRMMAFLSRLEWLPQKFLGTSLMAIFERANQAALGSPGKISGV